MHVALCDKFRRVAFTLAEVLITLGIIGVVAALTLPSLIDKYQKHVYYTQFMKAASSIENAFNALYNSDEGYDREMGISKQNWSDDFIKYFNVAQVINNSNVEKICGGYNKLPVGNIDGSGRNWGAVDVCDSELQEIEPFGFITNDGILIMLYQDNGYGSGNLIDTNGPNKGPNLLGRDVFVYYPSFQNQNTDELDGEKMQLWGYPAGAKECNNSNLFFDACGLKLLQEGKMNY